MGGIYRVQLRDNGGNLNMGSAWDHILTSMLNFLDDREVCRKMSFS